MNENYILIAAVLLSMWPSSTEIRHAQRRYKESKMVLNEEESEDDEQIFINPLNH